MGLLLNDPGELVINDMECHLPSGIPGLQDPWASLISSFETAFSSCHCEAASRISHTQSFSLHLLQTAAFSNQI